MINDGRNRFIKQHIQLYGEELFLNSSPEKLNKKFHEPSKIDLLKNLSEKIDIDSTSGLEFIENKMVFGAGDSDADLLIIGESPGDNEIQCDRPFLGRSGKLLDKILKAIGYSRSYKAYLTYLIKCKINGSRNPLSSEVKKFIPFLIEQVKIIEPKIIVGLGKTVGKALINKNLSLEMMRNEVYNFSSYPLKITYSPKSLLREQSLKKLAWEDFKFIRDFAKQLT